MWWLALVGCDSGCGGGVWGKLTGEECIAIHATVRDTGDSGDTALIEDDTGRGDTADGPRDSAVDTDTAIPAPPDSGLDSADPGDSGDTAAACGAGDVVQGLEIRDSSGAAGSTFSSTDRLTVVVMVANPCSVAVDLPLPDGVLAYDLSVVDSTGFGMGMETAGSPTHVHIAAASTYEEAYSWGTLDPESYTARATFWDGASLSTAFVVK